MKRLICILIFLQSTYAFAQNQTIFKQNIKGIVRDVDSKSPLVGVAVVLANTQPLLGVVSDENGEFKLENIDIGRYDLKISFVGYEPSYLSQVLVTSGKEVFLTLDLKESVEKLAEVVIKANKGNHTPLNEMASLSARSFSVEEAKRYPGGFADPARMAMNFAGVTGTSDQSNEIVVRGNTPKGVLWRLEGIEIPNPNHFGQVGSGGGGVSMLSAGTLSNSDFYTGAFPAEFGNALSGVFDLKLRNGNTDRRENAFQIGALGLEATTEGYFKKGERASYLLNYRYSTTGLIATFIPFLAEFVPKYQDASFKINVPTKKYGTFALFGLGGYNISKKTALNDSTKWKSSGDNDYFSDLNRTGVLGLTHKLFFSDKTYLNTVVAYSTQKGVSENGELIASNKYAKAISEETSLGGDDVKFNFFLNHKINAQHTLRIGANGTHTQFNLRYRYISNKKWLVPLDNSGAADFIEAYAQWKYRLTERWTLNTGLHYSQLVFNKTASIEPRLALQWQVKTGQILALSAGFHSKPEHISVYTLDYTDATGVKTMANKNLKLPQAFHAVLGFDQTFGKDWRIKMETYYQHLFNIGVEKNGDRSFSMLNESNTLDLLGRNSLISTGTGNNYGLDLTLEKFFSDNYYVLLTSAIFDSKYQDEKGKTLNSYYNSRYSLTILGGKDFNVGKSKKHILSLNMKNILRGGNRFTPINEIESKKQKREVRYLNRRFETQAPAYWRVDWNVQYKINKARLTHTWLIDIQNTLNHKNVQNQYFDVKTLSLKYNYQLGFLPNVSYRVEF
jgi:hypothetical protein